ncbi:hypothetical protein HNO86_16835 [Pseudomonas sp. C1C7]|uniref:hypothetical protein n=1 Tax=Pseudomonas sp. C1C7 TaxID=2735272 RepID=UPI001585E5A9|nr:hypothetical protein [Pseudomonas sp. C1C7]NUT76712.1 hypothetical protein [Pseudomonas sp. C1C7]
MAAPSTRKSGKGTINAIRKVWVDATSTTFAIIMADDGRSRLAVRIGLNLTEDGDDYFLVGDRVRYTVVTGSEFPRAQDLMKFPL